MKYLKKRKTLTISGNWGTCSIYSVFYGEISDPVCAWQHMGSGDNCKGNHTHG